MPPLARNRVNIFFFDLSTVLFVEGSFGRISELLLKGDWANCFIDCCWLLIFHRLKAACTNLSGTIMWMACLIKLVLNVVIIIVARDNGGNWTKLSSKKSVISQEWYHLHDFCLNQCCNKVLWWYCGEDAAKNQL